MNGGALDEFEYSRLRGNALYERPNHLPCILLVPRNEGNHCLHLIIEIKEREEKWKKEKRRRVRVESV